MAEVWADVKAKSAFDLAAYEAEHGKLTFFQKARLVNYFRSLASSGRDAQAAASEVTPTAALWSDEALLRPVLSDDPVLTAVADEDNDSDGSDSDEDDGSQGEDGWTELEADAPEVATAVGANKATASSERVEAMSREQLVALVGELRGDLQRSSALIRQLASAAGSAMPAQPSQGPAASDGAAAGSGAAARGSAAGDEGRQQRESDSADPLDADYYSSYSSWHIHHTMLFDRPRTEAYRDALERNGEHLAGKRVLDIGCGTAILSLFAARAGAGAVIGVDNAAIAAAARESIARAGRGAVVEVRSKRAEELEPQDLRLAAERAAGAPPTAEAAQAEGVRADAIVSEWMGYALLFENMLESVLVVRDRLLAPGGRLLPDRARVWAALVSWPQQRAADVDCWADVYGFDMEHLRPGVLKEAHVMVVPGAAICSSTLALSDLDLLVVGPHELDVEASGEVEVSAAEGAESRSSVQGICIWFDVGFEGRAYQPGSGASGAAPPGWQAVEMTTSPHAQPTHWKQTMLWLEEPVEVAAGERVPLSVAMCRRPDAPRSYRFKATVGSAPEQQWDLLQ